ncbi:hypothetical protein [Niabella soli]|uniref:Lipocalin-like domain-containing protein n=1 Tax=Niabella soli DSM 19437 TaxID=929713 RepID=W0F819_9BACT|nr:hypothetical protein [Niabella soli]AHF17609.1 hypothetical protein NIASO_11005 [Niabella soli DSM 19437]
MKTISRLFFAAAIVASIGFASCQRTKDALGLDTMYNSLSTGRWVAWTTTTSPGATMDNLPAGGYVSFNKNGTAWAYDGSGQQIGVQHNYSIIDTKTMVFDNVTYKIQENFAGSFKTLTLVNASAGVTTTQAFSR